MGTNTYIAWGQVVPLTETEPPRPVEIIRHVRIDLGKMYETPLEALCIKTQTDGVQRGSLLMEDGNTDHVEDGTGRPVVWVDEYTALTALCESAEYYRRSDNPRVAERSKRLRAIADLLAIDMQALSKIAVLLWRS